MSYIHLASNGIKTSHHSDACEIDNSTSWRGEYMTMYGSKTNQ